MALGIMIAGLLAAVLGTALAMAMGLDLGTALFFYGLSGIFGGIVACLASLPILRNVDRQSPNHNRTTN